MSRKRNNYWTLEKCIDDSLKYTTKSDWIKNSAGAYDAAHRNGWLDICSKHMKIFTKPKGFWTLEHCQEDALKFTNKLEWAKISAGAYDAAIRNNWMELCCKHMISLGSKYRRLIYAFEFSDKSVYVGLTFNIEKRKSDHLLSNKSAVHKFIQKTKLDYEFKVLSDYLDRDNASIEEGKFLKIYKDNGWRILNRIKTGGLGGDIRKWTKETCIIEALKYSTKTDWINAPNASYQIAVKHDWFEDCCRHMIKPKKVAISLN
jgi:hypothetical protein